MSKLTDKLKTFAIGTKKELREKFSGYKEGYLGWACYIIETSSTVVPIIDFMNNGKLDSVYSIPFGIFAVDGLFRMGVQL